MIAIAAGFALGGLLPLWVLLDYLKAKRAQKKYQDIITLASRPMYHR